MTAPSVAALYWLRTLGIGGILGVAYGFLRPLRPRLTILADSLFSLCLLWGWVYMTFGICGGDSRLGCTAALFLGAWLFDRTAGRWLRPVFRLFWKVWGRMIRLILWPAKKIFQFFCKFYIFLLAILKKWVTIVWTSTKEGGFGHEDPSSSRQAGAEKDQPRHKSSHRGRSRFIGGGDRRPIQLH